MLETLEKIIHQLSFSGKRFLATGLAVGMLLGNIAKGEENQPPKITGHGDLKIENGVLNNTVIWVEEPEGQKIECSLDTDAEGLSVQYLGKITLDNGDILDRCLIPRHGISNIKKGAENKFRLTLIVKDEKGAEAKKTNYLDYLDSSSIPQEIINFDLYNGGRYLKKDYFTNKLYNLEVDLKLGLQAKEESKPTEALNIFPFYLSLSAGFLKGTPLFDSQSGFDYHYSGGLGLHFMGGKAIRNTSFGWESGWQEARNHYAFSAASAAGISGKRKMHQGGIYTKFWGEEIGHLSRNETLENFEWFLKWVFNPRLPSYFFYEEAREKNGVEGIKMSGGLETYFDGSDFGLAGKAAYELQVINKLKDGEDKLALFEASLGPKYKLRLGDFLLEFLLKGEIYQEEKNKSLGYFNFDDLFWGFEGGINFSY